MSIIGWYYLHQNSDLIYKHEFGGTAADIRESDFARGLWPMDPEDRAGAWRSTGWRDQMARKHKFIRTTIAEPFPVFYSHVNQKCQRANDPATEGPFYSAGSEYFRPLSDDNMAWVQKSAEHLRGDGYTVTVDVIER